MSKSTEEWTVVLPNRGKRTAARKFPQLKTIHQQKEDWVPLDNQTDSEKESKLMKKMQDYIKKLEESRFCSVFLDNISNREMSGNFEKVLGSKSTMQMVVYGIGSIESFEAPRWQLGLAILMKRRFEWIGNIEVFDPVISLTESRVMESLGCCVLSVNEYGRRKAVTPTLFFMPHCEAELYENLLEANWKGDLLNRMVILGNSFEIYETSVFKKHKWKHMMAARKFVEEFEVDLDLDDCYYRSFNGSSFQFFRIPEFVVDFP